MEKSQGIKIIFTWPCVCKDQLEGNWLNNFGTLNLLLMKGFLLDNELQAFFIIKKENFYCSFNVEFSNGMKCKFHIINAVNVLFMWYITYIMLMDAVVTSFHGLVFLCSHLNYGKCMLLIFFQWLLPPQIHLVEPWQEQQSDQ